MIPTVAKLIYKAFFTGLEIGQRGRWVTIPAAYAEEDDYAAYIALPFDSEPIAISTRTK